MRPLLTASSATGGTRTRSFRKVLLTATDDFLRTLPPEIVAEAEVTVLPHDCRLLCNQDYMNETTRVAQNSAMNRSELSEICPLVRSAVENQQ